MVPLLPLLFATLGLGLLLGFLLRGRRKAPSLDDATTPMMMALLFVIGLKVGRYDIAIQNIGRFGAEAFVIALSTLALSLIFAKVMRR